VSLLLLLLLLFDEGRCVFWSRFSDCCFPHVEEVPQHP